ncbi:3-mercaptopyruvate sulfurtransferase [Fodinicurvata fenggangensis]|uniref:3-mercaptopyruvate sulfurtransferase n=1 Tax=Fodinicurvata fenggangensis TaxID=1121830 RepID=UPI00047EA2AD|nr:3-mercaptopyruvate sulfurtransferase [Fodinicurvata fenggangensis]
MTDSASPLVSTEWLERNLNSPDLRVVDATYYLPVESGDARAEYEQEHIPGAVFFDIDDIKDNQDSLPHMLPPPEVFSSKVRKLGLGDGTRIVVYDRKGLMSAPRVWWMFRVFGHRDVFVLDGGLPKWKAEQRPLDDHPVLPEERHFTARLDTTRIRDRHKILGNIEAGEEQVVDARSTGRFEGRDHEPWPGRQSGRIPGSYNVPYTNLIDAESGCLKTPSGLRRQFEEAGVDLKAPIVTSCGSGITAAALAMALDILGHRDVALYDGSWAEWGLAEKLPIDKGPASKASASTER